MDSELGMMMMMMHMSFYNSNELILLFKGLDSEKQSGKYVGLLILTAVLCVLLETLGHFRNKLIRETHLAYKVEFGMKQRLMIAANYLLSLMLSYAIMLIIMSFNVGVFLVVCLTLAACRIVISYLRRKSVQRIVRVNSVAYSPLAGGN